MQLSSSEPCVVILTEKEVEVSVNNHATCRQFAMFKPQPTQKEIKKRKYQL
ncbi:hypothetical protein QK059_001383 [Escherichia coli]|nr:hypothetical protein [Escherichia coli]